MLLRFQFSNIFGSLCSDTRGCRASAARIGAATTDAVVGNSVPLTNSLLLNGRGRGPRLLTTASLMVADSAIQLVKLYVTGIPGVPDVPGMLGIGRILLGLFFNMHLAFLQFALDGSEGP